MRQYAPDPEPLIELVPTIRYKEGWTFELHDIERDEVDGVAVAGGLTLVIYSLTQDAYHPERRRGVIHYRIVPSATYNHRSWIRWVLDQIIEIETHEACEFFQIADGVRPYAPTHGPGNDPYTIRELCTELDQRTSFRGTVNL